MQDVQLGRVVRALRRRRGWRQADVAVRAGVSHATVSVIERGLLDAVALPTLRRCLLALEVRLDLVPRWRGADLERLLDEDHSRVQAAWKERLERWGWVVAAEVSFNRFGDRGRIDLLAWHPEARVLLVAEIKTIIADVQGLLGPLDVKLRVARTVARERGWFAPSLVLPLLVVTESATNRRRLAARAALFSQLNVRGRAAVSWLRRPEGRATGLLVLSDLSPARVRSVSRGSRVRMRRAAAPASGSSTQISPGNSAESHSATVAST